MPGPEYVTLTITDRQNGNTKAYKVERGSRLILSNETNGKYTESIHTINKNTTVDLTLPQYQALQAYDHNNDNKLDSKDKDFYINRHQKYLESLPEEAFDGLYHEDRELYNNIQGRLGDSEFHVSANGGGAVLGVDQTGFYVLFENKYWNEELKDNEYRNTKEICFQTPDQAKFTDEQERLENERLDIAYAEKHWIRALFGITREEYEKNNTRDY